LKTIKKARTINPGFLTKPNTYFPNHREINRSTTEAIKLAKAPINAIIIVVKTSSTGKLGNNPNAVTNKCCKKKKRQAYLSVFLFATFSMRSFEGSPEVIPFQHFPLKRIK